eukprot:m.165564 g.165564  ORF g.165564 m.165564 type:complete len:1066 (+) comp16598_c1_seq1:104-3301(+)
MRLAPFFYLLTFACIRAQDFNPERWRMSGILPYNSANPGRLLRMPPTMFFDISDEQALLRYSREEPRCGNSLNSTFCLQSQGSESWLGLIAAHYPVGEMPFQFAAANDTHLTVVGSNLVYLNNTNGTGDFASMYFSLLGASSSFAGVVATRVELTFVCDRRVQFPSFPVINATATSRVIEQLDTRVYELRAAHSCACLQADSECEYFASNFDRGDAVTHWRDSAAERQGDVTECMKIFTDDLSFLWGLSLGVILGIWIVDLFLSWPRLGLPCVSQNSWLFAFINRFRPADVAYERQIGSLRYVLLFGWMDVLTPPAHFLETDEIAWPTAAGFGAMSIVVPGFANGAMEITQVLVVLIFFVPLILCRYARTQTLALMLGAGYSIAVLQQVWTTLSCFGDRQSVSNVFAMLPSTLCITFLAAWYWWQVGKRAQYLYERYTDTAIEETSWRLANLQKLDRRPYIQDTLACIPRAPLHPSFGWAAFRDTLTGANHYMVPTRLLCAVLLSICIVLSIIPSLNSMAGLLGAMGEFAMSGGHCCEGKQCDPTPGAQHWISDWLHMGVGLQLGQGQNCDRDQIVIRRALRVGITLASSLIAFALCCSLVHTLVVYRKRMLLLYRGQPDFIIKPVPVRESISAALKYGGTQVASTLAALFLGTIVLTVIILFLVVSTVLPIMGLYGDWFWPWWFKFAIFDSSTGQPGFLAMVLTNYWLLMLITRFAFRKGVDDRGLQRRGLFAFFDAIEFIFYMFNALLGLAKRAITSILFQVIFMGRMDKSLMPRKHELWDKSYVSYLGFMQLDLFYSHPILLTACYFWLREVEPPAALTADDIRPSLAHNDGGDVRRRPGSISQNSRIDSTAMFKTLPSEDDNAMLTNNDALESKTNGKGSHRRMRSDVSVLMEDSKARLRRLRTRNRLWVAVTLHNNPGLQLYRSHTLKDRLKQLAGDENFRQRAATYSERDLEPKLRNGLHHLNPFFAIAEEEAALPSPQAPRRDGSDVLSAREAARAAARERARVADQGADEVELEPVVYDPNSRAPVFSGIQDLEEPTEMESPPQTRHGSSRGSYSEA